MAGCAELDRGRGLRAKCKSNTTWNHHERRQNNSVENVFQRFALSFVSFILAKETWFQMKNFYFCMTNTLRRTQNLNLWFQPENSRFEVRDRSSRTSWHAQWLSCCKNTSGWRPWYQERLVLKFPINNGSGARLEIGASGLQVKRSNRSATLPPLHDVRSTYS